MGALIVSLLLQILCLGSNERVEPIIIPAMPSTKPYVHLINVEYVQAWLDADDASWSEFHEDAVNEYVDLFTDMFNAVEYKISKNGRSMTKGAYSRGFKFI